MLSTLGGFCLHVSGSFHLFEVLVAGLISTHMQFLQEFFDSIPKAFFKNISRKTNLLGVDPL